MISKLTKIKPIHILTAIVLAVILGIAISIRQTLYKFSPIFLSNDAWDYLYSAWDIYHRLDYFSKGLYDARLPGYPTFLALIQPITRMQSNRIVLVQSALGIANLLVGIAIGYLLRSKVLAVVLGLFLAFNPVFLLNEHGLLSEVLFLFTLLVFTFLLLISLRWKANWVLGGLIGITAAIGILTRGNGLIYYGAALASLVLIWFFKEKDSKPIKSIRLPFFKPIFGFVIAGMICGAILLGPWFYRNYLMYGKFTLINLTYRNLIYYKGLHGYIDYDLPLMREVNHNLQYDFVNVYWWSKLSEYYHANGAEEIAQQLLNEQITNHPAEYFFDIWDSFICFGGNCSWGGGERGVTRLWFKTLIPHPKYLNKSNKAHYKGANPEFLYIVLKEKDESLDQWSDAGLYYLEKMRPFFYALFFIAISLYELLNRLLKKNDQDEYRKTVIRILTLSYLATVVFHAVTLAGFDRYSTPFDFVPLIVVVLIGQYLIDMAQSGFIVHPKDEKTI